MIRTYDKASELLSFRQEILNRNKFNLTPVTFESQSDWTLTDGAVSHKSGGFFHIVGIQNELTKETKTILYQPQSAVTGLLINIHHNKIWICLQARAEPGNTGIVQFGPSIQSTAANYMKLHGGKDTDFLPYFLNFKSDSRLLNFTMQTDLGELYYQKSKTHNYVEVYNKLESTQNTCWVELNSLFTLLQQDYFINTDLRSLLAMYDWDHFLSKELLETPINEELLTYFFRQKATYKNKHKIIPLDKLLKWQINGANLIDLSTQRVAASLFRVKAATREISNWTQPLLTIQGKGLCLLYRRCINGQVEFLISVIEESGIDNGVILSPSVMLYPGENTDGVTKLGEVYRTFEHSEEGGRFLHYESIFEVRNVEPDMPHDEHQFWVSALELKNLFKHSNMVCIQLRVITSSILDDLNPITLNKASSNR